MEPCIRVRVLPVVDQTLRLMSTQRLGYPSGFRTTCLGPSLLCEVSAAHWSRGIRVRDGEVVECVVEWIGFVWCSTLASGAPPAGAAVARADGSAEACGRSMELLTAFDDAWVTYLEQFAGWKCTDALSLEVPPYPLTPLHRLTFPTITT